MKTRSQEIAQAAMTLYQIYPKHVGRAAALKAIGKALSRESYELLLDAVTAYAGATGWQERQFIPHPATWFNQERYHDDRECWQQPKQNGSNHKATSAYDTLCSELRRVGAGQVPNYPDEASRAAVKALGGWTTFCSWRSDQIEFRRRKFLEEYH